MKMFIPFFASLLRFFSTNANSDEMKEFKDSYPVHKCFCQSRSSFLNVTLDIKKTTCKIVTHYYIYKLGDTSGTPGNVIGYNKGSTTEPIDKDKIFTYSAQLSNSTSLRINLQLTNREKKTVNLFTFDEETRRACSDVNKTENGRCVITVELSKICQLLKESVTLEGQQGDLKQIRCNSADDYFHSWCLHYYEGSCIGQLPELPLSSETGINLYLEKFDDKMMVQCFTDPDETLSNTTLSVTSSNEILPILNYTSSDPIHFECEEYTILTQYVYVGVVNPYNMLSVQETPFINTFSTSDNGTILCCVYYLTSNNTITRHVNDKRVIIYNQYFESKDSDDTRPDYNMLYIAAGIASCTLLLFIMIAKKCPIKKSSSQQQLELETYIPTQRVIYADLDNLREESNRIKISNATPYATIIGSLHPKEN